MTAVAGKEQGGKDEHICLARGGEFDAKKKAVVKEGSKYPADRVVMGGDGGGDLKAAKKNGAFFYPTPPGQEEKAWANAVKDVFSPLFEGKYAELEPAQIQAFEDAMLTEGPWQKNGYDHGRAYLGLQAKRQQLYKELKPGGRLVTL